VRALQARIKRGYIMATAVVALIGLTMLTMFSPVVSTTEDFSIFNTGWNGTSQLAVLTYETGKFVPSFKTETSGADITIAAMGLSELALDPATDAVAVIGPSDDFSEAEGKLVGAFLRAGGVVLVADDFGSGNSLLASVGAASRFSGKLVIDLSFEKKPQFPVCYDLRVGDLTRNVSLLQLNYPSSITLGAGASGLAFTSSASWLDNDGNGLQDYGEPWGPFPVIATEQVGQGTLVLLSDPSVLINGMREQLDNARFADNLVSYISSSRTGVFFDESHRTYFDPVTVTTVFTGSVSNNWKGFILFAATFVTLWAVTDFVDRAFAWIAGSFRRAWSYISRRLGIGHREEPARPEVDIDALTQEVRGAHPEWREGVIRHVLKERRRHGRFLERSRERSG
jgi:hypothetical protein